MSKPAPDGLAALRNVDFDSVTHLDDVWNDSDYDVATLHETPRRDVDIRLDALGQSTRSGSPLGMVLAGQAGSGKTHFVSVVRQKAFERNMTFVLVDMTDVHDFWDTVLLGVFDSLLRPGPSGRSQFREVLAHLLESYPSAQTEGVTVEELAALRPPALHNRIDNLIDAVRKRHRVDLQKHQDVLRALVLLSSDVQAITDDGWAWLQGLGLDDEASFRYGFRNAKVRPIDRVRGLSWLVSLKGPMVMAFDQLDAIVTEHNVISGIGHLDLDSARARVSLAIIEGIAGGLMALRDVTQRTLSVVSCLEATWHVLEQKAVGSATDRFDKPILLSNPNRDTVARDLIERRLRAAYKKTGFTPPHATWPFSLDAFESTRNWLPRRVLRRADEHVKSCLRQGVVRLLHSFESEASTPPRVVPDRLAALDTQFEAWRMAADPAELIAAGDEALDELLEAVVDALVNEHPLPENKTYEVDKDFPARANYDALHVRIKVIHHDDRDREQHFCLRFLEHAHHGSFQARLRAAMTASGIDHALDFRRLRILRSEPVPSGKKTAELVDTFLQHGGLLSVPTEADLRTMAALVELVRERPADWIDWLRERGPVAGLTWLKDDLQWLLSSTMTLPVPEPVKPPSPRAVSRPAGPSSSSRPSGHATAPKPSPSSEPESALPLFAHARRAENVATPRPSSTPPTRAPSVPSVKPSAETLTLGHRLVAQKISTPLTVTPRQLAKHTAVLAGSGSGKTVFVRRLIEEASLVGIPSIVVDVANDLARLGMPWPESPPGWSAEDAHRAQHYFAKTDVQIWTPGRTQGNPLVLAPLPRLDLLVSDPDELEEGLELARGSLAPIVAKGSTAGEKEGLLTRVLRFQAEAGRHGLKDLLDLLSDLPPEAIGGYHNASKLAQTMANRLRARMDVDPLMREDGAPMDPAVLLSGSKPDRTRISVVNLSGLPSQEQQQSFLNQLAMTLFSWIKRHPAQSGIRGLLVIDEAKDFVPAGRAVVCRDSLLRLAAQARKYGLGLVFATQEPKSIDHRIIANCSTLLFGKVSSPAAREVVQEQLRARGTTGSDVPKLPTGVFYAYTEGLSAAVKIRGSMCLSHHPPAPLGPEDVVRLARASAEYDS